MPDARVNTSSAAALAEAKERYAARHRDSARLHGEACKSLPGGNTRSMLAVWRDWDQCVRGVRKLGQIFKLGVREFNSLRIQPRFYSPTRMSCSLT